MSRAGPAAPARSVIDWVLGALLAMAIVMTSPAAAGAGPLTSVASWPSTGTTAPSWSYDGTPKPAAASVAHADRSSDVERPAAGASGSSRASSAELVAPEAIRPIAGGSEALKLSETVAGHAASRPYVNSRLLVDEIMGAGKPIPDPGGLPNGLRWDVPGTRWGIGEGARDASRGTWELVVDADTGTIVHFLFRGGQ